MIEKAGKGTLQIEATANDGEVMIENVYYHADAELADAQTAELDWKRRNLYEGPPFANLDEDLQVLLERYLDERGVNTALAVWVPEYIDFKEQREYLGWLSSKPLHLSFMTGTSAMGLLTYSSLQMSRRLLMHKNIRSCAPS